MMRRSKVKAVWTCVLTVLVGLGACGGDDDDASGAGSATTESRDAGDNGDTADTTGDDGAPTNPACDGPPFTIDLRAADAYQGLDPFEDAAFEVTDTVAVKVADAAYTLYLTDYEIDRSIIGTFETPHPPDGKTLITLSITIFNAEGDPPPIEVGDVIPAGSEFGEQTFIVIVEQGADMYNSSPASSGEVRVLGLTDAEICVSVSYQDLEEDDTLNGEQLESPVQKRLAGTVSAEVIEMGF